MENSKLNFQDILEGFRICLQTLGDKLTPLFGKDNKKKYIKNKN